MDKQTIKEKQNSFSFRYGGTSTEVKLYFEDVNDLENQLTQFESKSLILSNKLNEIKKVMGQ